MQIRLIEDVSHDSDLGKAIHELVRTQLGNDQSLEATFRQIASSKGKTLLIGGFVDDQLATMNAFMPQTFTQNGKEILGYQSGFSATGSAHRGKGYWPKLLNESLDIVQAAGGKFIYGFPNPVSQPLFEKKLGFATASMWRTLLPAFATRWANYHSRHSEDFFRPDLRQLVASKQLEADARLVVAETETFFVFGKVRVAQRLSYVDIGGISSSDGRLNDALRALCKAARTSIFRFEASQSSEFSGSFRPARPSRPVIFKALGGSLGINDISFVGGLADNY